MPLDPIYKRGDVILVLFPHSDLQAAKTRPAVVVQADNLASGLPQVIVAMISSRMLRAAHPSRVVILLSSLAGRRSGLLGDSVNMADNLATIGNVAVHRAIGSLPMTEIDRALRHTLQL